MTQRTFAVQAIWDEAAQVWVSESDIQGLHIEAETLQEFEQLVGEFARELIVTNHMSDKDIADTPMRDLIPAIIMREPKAA